MNRAGNIFRHLQLLVTAPTEFRDRADLILKSERQKLHFRRCEQKLYPERITFNLALPALSEAVQCDVAEFLAEHELQEIQERVNGITRELSIRTDLPFPLKYNADSTLATLAYVMCRALRPDTVLETGVAYGVTSAIVLAALHNNGNGELHSIDLPPVADRETSAFIGIMIPPEFKHRWHLYQGASKRVLPMLLAKNIGYIDLFIHDSANLYEIQRMELETVWPHISSNGALILNGIHRCAAFSDFVQKIGAHPWFAIEQREKEGHLTGLIIKHQGILDDSEAWNRSQ